MAFAVYTLSDKGLPVLMCSRPNDREGLLAWAKWMTDAEREGRLRVGLTQVGGHEVSTTFLGVNLNGTAQRPLCFETGVFDDKGGFGVSGRSASLKDARALHDDTVLSLQASEKLKR